MGNPVAYPAPSLRYIIDEAITTALSRRKPVVLELCRDLPLTPHPTFGRKPPAALSALGLPPRSSNPSNLADAVDAINAWLAGKSMPLILVGRQAR